MQTQRERGIFGEEVGNGLDGAVGVDCGVEVDDPLPEGCVGEGVWVLGRIAGHLCNVYDYLSFRRAMGIIYTYQIVVAYPTEKGAMWNQ